MINLFFVDVVPRFCSSHN